MPRRVIYALIATAISLPILIGLGMWQLERLKWKTGILNAIDASLSKPPLPVDELVAMAPPDNNFEAIRFSHATAQGTFDHEKELYLFGSAPGERPGYRVVTPLVRDGMPTVLVVRGSVPDDLRAPHARSEGQITEPITVNGIVRTTEEQGLFGPDNDVEDNLWFHKDVAAMARASGYADALPVIIEADDTSVPGGWPKGRTLTKIRDAISNRHLEYAITWFSLAGVLIVISFFFVRGEMKAGRQD